jgi:hypothetical protein
LQAVASPLGHSTAGVDATAPRADDGIRTRDPHLGKVMRYQLRYIRAPRARSSPVAKDDDSPPQRSRTNPFCTATSSAAAPIPSKSWKAAEFSCLRRSVLIFDVVPRSRSSGGERPPHTRKVTGSIPVGTTHQSPRSKLTFHLPHPRYGNCSLHPWGQNGAKPGSRGMEGHRDRK